MHDETYKTLFAFPRMVEDLLRGFVGGEWVDTIDFTTLEKLPTEYVSEELRTRHGDTVWRVRRRNDDLWLHVLVLLEFQSTSDRDMALRILAYTALLYQDLARRGELEPGRRFPPVLPVVLYNGDQPWAAPQDVRELIAPVGPDLAPYQPSQRHIVLDEQHLSADDVPETNLMTALIRLEQSRDATDLPPVFEALQAQLKRPDDASLLRAFAECITRLTTRWAPAGAEVGPEYAPEDMMTLAERWAQWPAQWEQRGIEKGIEKGLEEGREKGLEHERALLRQMTATRFGPHVAEALAARLTKISDPDQLSKVGTLLVRAETGESFLAALSEPAPANERNRA